MAKFDIFHMPPKVLYTFQGMNPPKWGFHLRKCKAGNEAYPKFLLIF